MTPPPMTRQEVPPLLTLSRAVLATQWVRVGHNTSSYRCRRPVSREKKKKSRCLIFGTRTILPEMHVKITFFRSSARCGSTFDFLKNGFVRCAASSVFRVTFSVRGEVCSLCASSCHVALSGVVFVVSSRRGSKHAENMSVRAGTRSMGSYVERVGGGGGGGGVGKLLELGMSSGGASGAIRLILCRMVASAPSSLGAVSTAAWLVYEV